TWQLVSSSWVEFAHLPLGLAILGLWFLVKTRSSMAVFTLLLFAACVLYFTGYDFPDPDFGLHAWVVAGIWVAFGTRALLEEARSVREIRMMLSGCLLVGLAPLILNY